MYITPSTVSSSNPISVNPQDLRVVSLTFDMMIRDSDRYYLVKRNMTKTSDRCKWKMHKFPSSSTRARRRSIFLVPIFIGNSRTETTPPQTTRSYQISDSLSAFRGHIVWESFKALTWISFPYIKVKEIKLNLSKIVSKKLSEFPLFYEILTQLILTIGPSVMFDELSRGLPRMINTSGFQSEWMWRNPAAENCSVAAEAALSPPQDWARSCLVSRRNLLECHSRYYHQYRNTCSPDLEARDKSLHPKQIKAHGCPRSLSRALKLSPCL